MKYHGLDLPDDEWEMLENLQGSPIVEGFGTYQWHKQSLALKYVKRWQCAVDVGAHIGTWTQHLVRRFAQTIAFEPHAGWRAHWAQNVRAEDEHAVQLHPVALGDHAGEVSIAWHPGVSGHTYVSRDGARVAGSNHRLLRLRNGVDPLSGVASQQTVEMRTLDSFALESCDFLKIDTEGYERFVVDGGAELIQRTHPVVVVEQKPGMGQRYGVGPLAAVERLQSWGAVVRHEVAGDYILTWN